MDKTCISCGMPMTKAEHFPAKDMTMNFCVHCAKPDGSMRSYEETLEGMMRLMIRSQGIEETAARNTVKTMMARLPAWQSVSDK
jgi:hypothetical protein